MEKSRKIGKGLVAFETTDSTDKRRVGRKRSDFDSREDASNPFPHSLARVN